MEIVNAEFRKVCEFFRTNRLVLHPDKTKFILFTWSGGEQNLEIFCNNNKDLLLDPSLIKQISLVNSTDEIPAVKFLGIFIDSTTFLLNIIPL